MTLHDFYATCGLFFRLPDGVTPCDLRQLEEHCGPCIGSRGAFDQEEVRFRVRMRLGAFEAELRRAAFVTAPSASHARALERYLPDGIAVQAVAPGSPPIAPVVASKRTGPLRILHFGNLCRLKGVELLIRAVAAADPSRKMVALTLAGPIVEPGLRIEGATHAGPFDAEGLRSLAAEADLAAFPSFARESYSLVVDEALRLGLPVLVSDRGALAERVGSRGMVLPAGDEKAWAAAIARLASDAGALEPMRRGTHAILTTPDQHADRMLALYADARIPDAATVDLESPLLERLAHFDERLGDLVHLLSARKEKA